MDLHRIVSFPENLLKISRKSLELNLTCTELLVFQKIAWNFPEKLPPLYLCFSMEVKCVWNQFNAHLPRRRPTETYFIIEINYRRHPEYINLVESDPSFFINQRNISSGKWKWNHRSCPINSPLIHFAGLYVLWEGWMGWILIYGFFISTDQILQAFWSDFQENFQRLFSEGPTLFKTFSSSYETATAGGKKRVK